MSFHFNGWVTTMKYYDFYQNEGRNW